MHIVYKLIFLERKKSNQFPYYYIGSKSNCSIKDGKILDKKLKPYFGSSKYKDYNLIVQNNINSLYIEILYEGESYGECVKMERQIHIKENVVMSPEYFNIRIAMDTNYSNPDFCTMKNVASGKVCRVSKDHPDVLNNLWIGTTKGLHWYNNGIDHKVLHENDVPFGWVKGSLHKNCGEKNGFKGKGHSQEILSIIDEKRKAWISKNINPFKGKSHSAENKKIIGDKCRARGHDFLKKPVNQIDPKTNLIIKVWPSARDAALSIKGDIKFSDQISPVCYGRRKTALGFKWNFVK